MAKSHIIPEYFFRELREDASYLLMLHDKDLRPKKSPIGEYDKSILCQDCESHFANEWDDYGVRFYQAADRWEKKDFGELVYYQTTDFDYAKLKLFFVSLLWRAHESTRPFYERVKLGPYADQALDLLKRNEADNDNEFTPILFRFKADIHPEAKLHQICQNPFLRRFGTTFYQFHLNEYGLLIKVDKRPVSSPFDAIALMKDKPLLILEREFSGTPEERVLSHMAKKLRNRIR